MIGNDFADRVLLIRFRMGLRYGFSIAQAVEFALSKAEVPAQFTPSPGGPSDMEVINFVMAWRPRRRRFWRLSK